MVHSDFFEEKDERIETSQDEQEAQDIIEDNDVLEEEKPVRKDRRKNKDEDSGLNEGESRLLQERRKERRRKKIGRTIRWIIILALIIFIGYVYSFFKANARLPWAPEVDLLGTVTVELPVYEEKYQTQIDISGSVQANQTQAVQLRTSGAVTAVLVSEGDQVHKGDLLATVDDTDQKYNLSSIESQIAEAQINGTAKSLEQLLLQKSKYENQLEYTRAVASFDGTVISVEVNVGDYSDAGATLMTIIDSSKLKATVEVDEVDIQMLEKGMGAKLTSDAVPGQTIDAVVTYIPRIGRYTTQGIGVVDVEITIDNPPSGLLPGFSFQGVISIENEQTMLMVAQSAVTTSRGVSTVQKKMPDGSVQSVVVTVKYLGESLCQILSGDIKAGDTVIQTKTSDGAAESIMGMMGRGPF
ncbi:MAG: efflux RND transporter periplasmic adaptor subunit [Sphaerochaetaceae bacterium]|jgi:membrane fusion protein (multidrug efflux system)|nr:efflux RND transporter periplasmic adaptor subunit [Sphaerochaetaceae bacterium]